LATRTARIDTLRGILREQGVLLPAGAGPALRAMPANLEGRACPNLPALKLVLAGDLDAGHHYRQHFLVYSTAPLAHSDLAAPGAMPNARPLSSHFAG